MKHSIYFCAQSYLSNGYASQSLLCVLEGRKMLWQLSSEDELEY